MLAQPVPLRSSKPGFSNAKPGRRGSKPGFPNAKPNHVGVQFKCSFGTFKKAPGRIWPKMATDGHFKAIWLDVFLDPPFSKNLALACWLSPARQQLTPQYFAKKSARKNHGENCHFWAICGYFWVWRPNPSFEASEVLAKQRNCEAWSQNHERQFCTPGGAISKV